MQPELVVLDLSLPGLDVLLRARAARCNTPVLILTMCAAMGDRSVGLNVGAEDYLVRPLVSRHFPRQAGKMRFATGEQPLITIDWKLDA